MIVQRVRASPSASRTLCSCSNSNLGKQDSGKVIEECIDIAVAGMAKQLFVIVKQLS